jgi:hypothetical protein
LVGAKKPELDSLGKVMPTLVMERVEASAGDGAVKKPALVMEQLRSQCWSGYQVILRLGMLK